MATTKSEVLRISNARLAFPQLFQPRSFNGQGQDYFSASFILERGDPQIEKLEGIIKQLAKEQWKEKADVTLKALRATDKVALHDGDLKANFEGFAGNLYINASNKIRPLSVDAQCNPLAESDGKPYAGCYVNAHIQFWVQDNQYGKRINASLCGAQFVRDGDAFGGGARVSSLEDFEDVSQGSALAELA